MNRKLIALLLAATALATACSAQTTDSGSANTAARIPVVAMPSIDQFAAIFDADKGTPRLILPISPT